MRRIYLLCVLLVVSIFAFAENSHQTTEEHVSLCAVTLNPGCDAGTVTVSLESASSYSAIFMEIYLPEGYEFVKQWCENADEEMELVYAGRGAACKSSHTVQGVVQDDGALRVAAWSSSSATFKTSSTHLFSFFVKATPYAKPGNAAVAVKACHYTTAGAVQYDASDVTVDDVITTTTSAQCAVGITAENKWSTLILPFDAQLPDGVKAYRCSSNDEAQSVLCLTSVSALKAFTPYILYSETGYEGSVSGEINVADYPENSVVTDGLLRGALTTQQAQQGDYVLANKGETKFYRVATTKTIPAGKCWVSLGSGMSAKENLGLQVVTGINNVLNGKVESSLCYTIGGMKVSKMTPQRLYIVKGRKVIGK